MEKTYTFHVNGMHCKSCVFMTESEISEVPYVTRAKTSLEKHSVEVTGEFGERTQEEIAADLTKVLEKHGYSLSVEKQEIKKDGKWSDFKYALPIALGFAALFVLLQKTGMVNLISGEDQSYGTAFLIGVIASLSTCMAVVGGLVLSMASTFAKEGDRVKPQISFHLGRLIAFFILGGAIGAIGSAFVLNTSMSIILSVAIGLVMLIMGINLLDTFHWSKRLVPGMPKFISKHALSVHKLNHRATPFLVGIATFFLPCGFTQSMQIFTLGAGGFLPGALTMFVYALGTLPVLALISFSSFSIKNSSKAGIFFKSAGLIVIMFAVFNLVNALVVAGLVRPIFNF